MNSNAVLGSMEHMDELYMKSGSNEEASYESVRNAVMVNLDVVQYSIYNFLPACDEFMKGMKEFSAGRDSFKEARSVASSLEPVAPNCVITRS